MLDGWSMPKEQHSDKRDFMVDPQLNDTCDPELAEFGESCRDSILNKAYPGLLKAINTVQTR
jgi:hypothetical protein